MGLVNARLDAGGIAHDGGVATWREVAAVAPTTLLGKRRKDPIGWLLPFSVGETNAIKAASVAVQMVQVEVDVLRFDAMRPGEVTLDAAWRIYGRDGVELLHDGRSSKRLNPGARRSRAVGRTTRQAGGGACGFRPGETYEPDGECGNSSGTWSHRT